MANIVLSDRVTATTADLLNSTRLQTFETNGVVTIQLSADLATSSNNITASIQLPDGRTPVEDVLIPASGTVGMLDTRTQFQASYRVRAGGHLTLSFTVSGTAVGTYRVIFNGAG